MFTTLIVQPIFNLLVLIYAVLPGHNFGLAIIIFTLIVRLLMWPLIKKQLHHAKAMRELQPELKRIKKETKGNRQQESLMVMALYKEREINPFAPIGIVLVQLPILLGLYSGLSRLVRDHQTIIDFSYPALRDLPWMKELATDIGKFDDTLFGVVDLGRMALESSGVYWGALIIVALSALAQYYQSKQLMPTDKDTRTLRQIFKEASEGKQADTSETNAAVGRSMKYFIPGMVFIIGLKIAAALPLYWLAGSVIALVQQSRVLKRDESELMTVAEGKSKVTIIEGEVIDKPTPKPKPRKKPSKTNKKRRK